MSQRAWLVVLMLLAAVGLACNGAADGPPSDFCVTYADNPHLSSIDLAKGKFTIVGKGWFKCTKSPQEITVYVELQRKAIGVWSTVDQNSLRFTNPPAGKKSREVITATPCDEGRYRTRARARGIDNVGNNVAQTEWSLSAEVVDPCKKGNKV
jgi:hypothetical protein